MRKKSLLMMAVSIMLATANAPTAVAQDVGGVEISTTSILPIHVSLQPKEHLV